MRNWIFLFFYGISQMAKGDTPEAFEWANNLTLESVSNLSGGVKQGNRGLMNLDLTLKIDTQSASWWEDGTLFGYVLGNYGGAPSRLTGELQTLSNIETDNYLKLYEFWYQHSFAQGGVKLLFGLHDYNSTFYSLDSASVFSESSFGVGPEVAQVGPSIFANTATAVHLTFSWGAQYALLAVYDGIPGDPDHIHGTHIKFSRSDGLFKAAEWGFAEHLSYKIAVGGWQHTAEVVNPVDGNPSKSNQGYYAIGERYFRKNLAVFFQYGRASADTNQLDKYIGLGVVYSQLWTQEDTLGVGLALARNGAPVLARNREFAEAELVMEITYQRLLTEKITGQLSVYQLVHPSMNTQLDDALALGLRLYIEL